MFYHTTYPSPLGNMTLLADDESLLAAYFEGQTYFEDKFSGLNSRAEENAVLSQSILWLEAYFAGKNPDLALLSLSGQGTDFQKRIWNQLLTIPAGETTSYGQLAKICQCKSAQAVGAAIGKNPLLIFVPCHRVLSSTGELTGYSAGLERKSWLLEHEKKM
ncbi:methylated-DNA--[protein]-cysteine S-methyltransferase [Streptococcus loxodontisalivarius]|uniref:Methylated-DNA-[protein]-cysteine S-methyltransferase n=1 Tax=Streptococcus loxodontisalivarius TaxID=1349415 RepID=A0ABS2PVN3_9STRE|nr:methylated-DNA--[protein]-cysteine S-methyltransferase [Streptococcus loxodontisalivarius]MBM7643519.1 methylated-DNA-[protein]-cysteine S-methyltransferase [Streptococcus loxodontisalivarius]